MTAPAWPRLGDPSAPRLRFTRGGLPAMLLVIAAIIIFAVVGLANWIRSGDTVHIIGTAVGLALGLVGGSSFLLWWVSRWRPLRVAIADFRRQHPTALVVGARFPSVPTQTVPQTWSTSLEGRMPAQEAVLVVSDAGLSFYSTPAASQTLVLEVPWDTVASVEPVEFVESRIAYQGILLTGTDSDARLVFQPSTRGWPAMNYPTGPTLQALRFQIERSRGSNR